MNHTFSYAALYQFCEAIFIKMGCEAIDAETATRALLSADLRGVDSHGIARLSGYVRLWEAGRINVKPRLHIIHQTPSTAVLDADKALGLVSAPHAMQIAIDKARQVGTGWVSVQNSNHFGIAGYHAMLAIPNDMIGIAMTNASALVAPTFSKERLLGTNPIAVAIPAGKFPAFVADFATTTAANGKLEVLQRKNEPVPAGWVQTKEGGMSTDAYELKNGGAMLPLGGTKMQGSHKGFMLGSIVDIFSAILSGANYGPWVPPFPAFVPMPENMPGKGIGHFLGAMRIDAFRPAEEFKQNMDQWIERFKNSEPVDPAQKLVIPGEPERETHAYRMEHGFDLLPPVVEDLKKLGNKYGISF